MSPRRSPHLYLQIAVVALIWSAAFAVGQGINRRLATFPNALASPPLSRGPHTPCADPALSPLAAVEIPAPPAPRPTPERLRRHKCRALWQAVAPWSYSPELADYFCIHHELAGIETEWYWSLVYGFSNFGLTLRSQAPGLCYGPMDVKWPGFARQVGATEPDDLLDPRTNIRAHIAEASYYHRRTGRTGIALLSTVFYPASPREYHRWRPTDARLRRILATWYRKHPAGY
jgi:hypothetical protein